MTTFWLRVKIYNSCTAEECTGMSATQHVTYAQAVQVFKGEEEEGSDGSASGAAGRGEQHCRHHRPKGQATEDAGGQGAQGVAAGIPCLLRIARALWPPVPPPAGTAAPVRPPLAQQQGGWAARQRGATRTGWDGLCSRRHAAACNRHRLIKQGAVLASRHGGTMWQHLLIRVQVGAAGGGHDSVAIRASRRMGSEEQSQGCLTSQCARPTQSSLAG